MREFSVLIVISVVRKLLEITKDDKFETKSRTNTVQYCYCNNHKITNSDCFFDFGTELKQ